MILKEANPRNFAVILMLILLLHAMKADAQSHLANFFKINNNLSTAKSVPGLVDTEGNLKRSSIITEIRKNNVEVTAVNGKSITLTCSIDLDDKQFAKSGNYKVSNQPQAKSFVFNFLSFSKFLSKQYFLKLCLTNVYNQYIYILNKYQ